MPARLTAEETADLLGYAPTQKTPERSAVAASMPKKRLSAEETTAALGASRAPLPKVKDIRPTSPVDDSEAAPDLDALDPSTKLGAATRGAVQGGTLRFGDEIGGGVAAGTEAIGRAAEKIGLRARRTPDIEGHLDATTAAESDEKKRGTLADTYRGIRDSLRADNKTAQAAHPAIFGASELGAGMTIPVPGSSLMRGSVAARMGVGGLQAAGYGALAGAGDSEAKDMGGVIGDSARSALMSAPAGAAGGAMTRLMEKFGPHFAEKAGERSFQAAGARAGITDRAAKMGITEAQMPAEGRKFLEAGLIPTGLNPFRNPLKQTKDRALALQAAAGAKIGEAMEAADSSGASFDPHAAQEAMRAKMGVSNPLENENASKANKLVDLVGDLAPQGEHAAADSFAQANKMKSQAWKGADFRQDAKMVPELYKKANSGFRDDIQRQVGEATSPEVAASLTAANKSFGTASKAADLSEMALSRDAQKQQFSPLRAAISAGLGAGGGVAAGGATGAGVGAVLAPLVVNAIAARGPNFAAHFNEVLSKASTSPEAAVALERLAAQLGVKTDELYGSKLQQHFSGK